MFNNQSVNTPTFIMDTMQIIEQNNLNVSLKIINYTFETHINLKNSSDLYSTGLFFLSRQGIYFFAWKKAFTSKYKIFPCIYDYSELDLFSFFHNNG